MGQKLMQFYKLVDDSAGIKGKMALAQLTKIPSTIAALEPDSEENIKLFEEAVKEVLAEALSET